MTNHAVAIAGAGPTGLMLAGELALARVDVAIGERSANHEVPGRRAGGLHSRTIEVLDQRGIAERFLSQGKVMQVAGFAMIPGRSNSARMLFARATRHESRSVGDAQIRVSLRKKALGAVRTAAIYPAGVGVNIKELTSLRDRI